MLYVLYDFVSGTYTSRMMECVGDGRCGGITVVSSRCMVCMLHVMYYFISGTYTSRMMGCVGDGRCGGITFVSSRCPWFSG